MPKPRIMIVGAGAAGAMAANILAEEGLTVQVLEALERPGGRIFTLRDQFSFPAEAGAEFIHGHLPLTMRLLSRYGINFKRVEGEMISRFQYGWEGQNEFVLDPEGEIEAALNVEKAEISVSEFLDKYFAANKYSVLRESVRRFIEGYETASQEQTSIDTLRTSWLNADQDQFRVDGGYSQVIERLLDLPNITISFGEIVTDIVHEPHSLITWCKSGMRYRADRIILTVPPPCLGEIAMSPVIPQFSGISELGYGSVVKLLFEFSTAFWKEEIYQQKLETSGELSFIFTAARIPTWWTQSPDDKPLLSGWLGGPGAASIVNESDEKIEEYAIASLRSIFGSAMPLPLKSHIQNWSKNPFSRGSYSFKVPGMEKILSEVTTPVNDTVFVAGESYYGGENTGTVEAALQSGHAVAMQILDGLKR